MNLVKWDPFRELEEVSNRLNRLFWRSPIRTRSDRELLTAADWTPFVDISETDAAYLIKVEIPGVKKESVSRVQGWHAQRHFVQVCKGKIQIQIN